MLTTMPIDQPNSALARTARHINEALEALRQGDDMTATVKLRLALGALGFAGNSQTKLIDALKNADAFVGGFMQDSDCKALRAGFKDAIAHASGPGID